MCARREAVKALLQLGLAVELCWHCYCIDVFFFFFSSRRRHTRSLCDWISDVCSSDLPSGPPPKLGMVDPQKSTAGLAMALAMLDPTATGTVSDAQLLAGIQFSQVLGTVAPDVQTFQIGRASCRERV